VQIDQVLHQVHSDRLGIENDLAFGNRLRAKRRLNIALSMILNHLRKPEPELSAWFRIAANLAQVDRPPASATQLNLWPISAADPLEHSPRPGGCCGVLDGEFITQDQAVLKHLKTLEKLALTKLPILLEGESGTGKEVLSRGIHKSSRRHDAPWVTVNCGAIPIHLQESELFGHARGAYTGATMEKPGLFEVANGGTLFLDEIGEMDPQAQVKLLRVLENGEIRRLGEVKLRHVDVRIVAATNADVDQAVREKRFRSDLLHRLGAVRVEIPPLRRRVGDIVPLAHHFIRRGSSLSAPLTPAARSALVSHRWPGNVRELKFSIDRALALWEPACAGELTVEMLFPIDGARNLDQELTLLPPGENLERYLSAIERRLVESALNQCDGNRTRAAALLGGLSRTTLISKMKRLGLFSRKTS
jgi:two-component system, NtrC family, response regulator AtoC